MCFDLLIKYIIPLFSVVLFYLSGSKNLLLEKGAVLNLTTGNTVGIMYLETGIQTIRQFFGK